MELLMIPFVVKDFNAGQLKYGFASLDGKVVVEAVYDQALPFTEGVAFVMQNGLWGCIDLSGQLILPIQYGGVSQPFSDNIAVVQKGNFWGAIDNNGNEIISFRYSHPWKFNAGRAWVRSDEGKYGFIDTNGKVLIDFLFDGILNPGSLANEEPFREFLIIERHIGKERKYGLLSMRDYAVVVPCIFEFIYHYDTELFKVQTGGKYGVITCAGTLIVPPVYDEVVILDSDRCLAILAKTFSLFDGNGLVIRQIDDMEMRICAGMVSDGLILAYHNRKYGYLNYELDVIIPFIYDDGKEFCEGFAAVQVAGKWGFINSSGALWIPLVYEDVHSFSEGFAGVRLDNGWGFVNNRNILLCEARFDSVSDFNQGLAWVFEDTSIYNIDKSGRIIHGSAPSHIHPDVWLMYDTNDMSLREPEHYVNVRSGVKYIGYKQDEGNLF